MAGVHNIKTLKLKLREEEDQKFNSPWNIATDFEVEMDFQEKEIATMLLDYIQENGVEMEVSQISAWLYFYTSGYPFLVSMLCKLIDEKLMTEKKWDQSLIEKAVKLLLEKSNTNFESIIKNLKNRPQISQLAFDLLIQGEQITYNANSPTLQIAEQYGVLKNSKGKVSLQTTLR